MENQEKTEMKEKKWMRPETKTALGALIIGVASILCALTISSSDSFTGGEPMASAAVAAVVAVVGIAAIAAGAAGVAVVAGAAVVAVVAVVAGVAGAAGVVFVVGAAGAAVVIGVWDKKEKEVLLMPSILLCLVFALPLFMTITPLSRYHNYRQLEKDQKIVEILQLRVLEDGVEVLLPDKYSRENSYLKKVFSVGWEGEENKKKWEEIVVSCREGEKHWFYVRLPFAEKKIANLELFFDHAYQDYRITLK